MLSNFAGAQTWDFGVTAGGTYYYGDVVDEFNYQNMRYYDGAFIRKNLDRKRSIRVNVAYIRIIGLDSLGSSFQKGRNLNFYTDIYEGSIQYEYNLIEDISGGRKGKVFTPYIFGGIGAIYFTPKTVVGKSKFELSTLKTAGITYSQIAIVFPLGGGIRYALTPNLQLGFEGSIRITSTSDLDDIRGKSVYPDPAKLPNETSRLIYDRSPIPGYGKPGRIRGKLDFITDCYFLYGLTLSYRIGNSNTSRSGFVGGRSRCPRFY